MITSLIHGAISSKPFLHFSSGYSNTAMHRMFNLFDNNFQKGTETAIKNCVVLLRLIMFKKLQKLRLNTIFTLAGLPGQSPKNYKGSEVIFHKNKGKIKV